jgi:DNA-binding IclR family transcriptional regulator
VGKALLSGLSSGDLAEMVRRLPMSPRTPRTLTDPEALLRQIGEVRERGWAVDDMENEPGVRCVGAPIRDYRDQVIAAVSTSGPATVLTPDRDAAVARHVMEAARQISRRLGWMEPANQRAGNKMHG